MATRTRKRHIQTELDLKRDKNGQRRGGKRPHAGRTPNGPRPGSPHKARPDFQARHPQHVTMRVASDALYALRNRESLAVDQADLSVFHGRDGSACHAWPEKVRGRRQGLAHNGARPPLDRPPKVQTGAPSARPAAAPLAPGDGSAIARYVSALHFSPDDDAAALTKESSSTTRAVVALD